jgi:hypothetical protein
MAVIQEGPGSGQQRGRRGGTKGDVIRLNSAMRNLPKTTFEKLPHFVYIIVKHAQNLRNPSGIS